MARRASIEELKKYVTDVTENKYELLSNEYKNCKTKVTIIHKECNRTFEMTMDRFKAGNRCPLCSRERDIERNKSKSLSNEDFLKRVKENIGDEYIVLSEYKTCHDKVKIKHLKCNKEYEVLPRHIMYDKNECPYCKKPMSKGEEFISSILERESINYIYEYKDIELNKDRNNYLYSYDFAIFSENNRLLGFIEFDGEFHFKSWDNKPKNIRKTELQKKSDKLKNKYCEDNNIPLLRIKYTDKDIENILIKYLKEIIR